MVRANVFYPRGISSAEARLRFYASQFSVVEVDATYYAMPERPTAELWSARTPGRFRFYIKAHALMTGQPTEVARLPRGLVECLPADVAQRNTIYATDLPAELRDAVWERFISALSPLAEAGKLGGLLLQYPRWFLPTRESEGVLDEAAQRLAGIPAAVEFRNTAWFDTTRHTARTLDLLRGLGLTHVMVDGPQGTVSSVPRVAATTTPHLAMVRLHGRRAATWELRGVPTVERYRYCTRPPSFSPGCPSSNRQRWRPRAPSCSSTTATETMVQPMRAKSSPRSLRERRHVTRVRCARQ